MLVFQFDIDYEITLWLIFVIWQAYYRQGVALQCLGKHADALAAFSSGLAEDPKSGQLLSGLMEAAIKSPLKGKTQRNIYFF